MTNRVFVLDVNRVPLAPCHPARARELLRKGKATVIRKYPFTVILNRKIPDSEIGTEPLTIKVDPGSRTTGMAIVLKGKHLTKCVFGLNVEHRGIDIVNQLTSRRQTRRARRNRKTRYRQPRFLNRVKPKGWIPPSIQSRVNNIQTWIDRFLRFCRLDSSAVEVVSFDTQKMRNPNIFGVGYQQGTLKDFEVKEYLLYRYNHTCQYCNGASKDQILEREHIQPRIRGGSNRLDNLTLACKTCNTAKGANTLENWLAQEKLGKTTLAKTRVKGIQRVQKGIRPPMRDSAAATIVSKRTLVYLEAAGLCPTTGPGYQTKYNRSTQGYRKDHWIDAVCVGSHGGSVYIPKDMSCLTAKAQKSNNRQMCLSDKYGFPRTSPKGPGRVFGFRTGDMVLATVLDGKYKGVWVGRVAVRATGSFDIVTSMGKATVNHKTCRCLHRKEGYTYTLGSVSKLSFLVYKGISLKRKLKELGINKYRIVTTKSIDRLSLKYDLSVIN